MVAITATNSATSSLQSLLNRSRLEQAQRDADQAEADAKDLRSQANQAEQDAQQGQKNVQAISAEIAKADTANSTYANLVNGATSEVPTLTQDFLVQLYNATSQQFANGGNSLKTNPNSAPVLNSQGQATGRIVNISA